MTFLHSVMIAGIVIVNVLTLVFLNSSKCFFFYHEVSSVTIKVDVHVVYYRSEWLLEPINVGLGELNYEDWVSRQDVLKQIINYLT